MERVVLTCLAPKALCQLSPGASPQALKLVEMDAWSAQQVAVFLLKHASAMVLLLRLDVLQHTLHLA